MRNRETNTTSLYRIENPNIPAKPNGATSHEDLVGQWFSPDLDYVTNYLRKSTQTFGKEAAVVDGAQLVVADVPSHQLEHFLARDHAIAKNMDIESIDNYILPRDGSIEMETIALDDTIGELRGQLGRFDKLHEAKMRIAKHMGRIAVEE